MIYIYLMIPNIVTRRPLSLLDEDGCILAMDDGIANFDSRGSLYLPISVIDSRKFSHLVCIETRNTPLVNIIVQEMWLNVQGIIGLWKTNFTTQ